MFKAILCKAVSVIRKMNQWWDKDEDKGITSVVAGIIILLGILLLNKAVLFIISFVLVANRVAHRFNLWTSLECDISDEPISSEIENDKDEK